MSKRAIGYIRSSRFSAADPSTSADVQEDAIRRYCEMEGWTLVDLIADLNVSGSERGRRLDRPGLKRARDMYGAVDVLIAARLDRVARSVRDLFAIIEEAQGFGVDVVFVRERVDTSSPFGRFLVTVLASLAALEAETTRERTESGKAAAREQGRFLGAAVPFGLATEPHPAGGKRLVPDPDRAAILHEAVDRLDNGQSWYSVTQWLNSTPHRAGKGDWTTQRVRAVLRSK